MGRRGAHTAKQALRYADAVRTGRVSSEETAAFIAQLHTDVAYWQEEQQRNDEVIGQVRPE